MEWMVGILVGTFLAVLAQARSGQPEVNTCILWPGSISSLSLQAAVNQYDCVQVDVGTFVLDAQVVMPSNHTLFGADAQTVLKANDQLWQFSCCDAVIASVSSQNVSVRNLTLDGSGVATYLVAARGMTVDHVTMKNGRCSGVGIAGTGMIIQNSQITNSAQTTSVPNRGNINCATGNTGGVELGAGIYAQGTADNYAPQILNNVIINNVGPALDVNGAWGGHFNGNTVYGNQGWAAVSLYGASNWEINGNTISHPNNQSPQPYHPYCARGPAGGHSAGIFLCQDTDQNNLVTDGNTISNNATSSYYGILSVGAYSVAPYMVPRNNSFLSNNVIGSNFGCADNFSPGQWYTDMDVWTGNNCAGTANTGPSYFQ